MSANVLLILPIVVPLGTAVLCLGLWRRMCIQRWLAVGGAAVLLVAAVALLLRVNESGPVATQLGGWPAPFGITLVADLLGAVMAVVAALVALAALVFSLSRTDRRAEALGFYPLVHILLMGVSGAFLTGDIFNLYVWFEVMLMASFVLIGLGGRRVSIEAAVKYVTLNLVSSVLFLSGVGILYGLAGTLNMADLASKLPSIGRPMLLNAVAALFLTAFGIKAAVFPLFFWLPASYPTPPVPVAALFSGLLTKVGAYSLIRMFSLVFVHDPAFTHAIILVVAALTMLAGVLGAYAQNEVRRVLSFHIISQIGYIIMGLGLFTTLGLAGAVFFTVHNILAKVNLFLVAGIVDRLKGSFQLARLGGLYNARPLLGILFLIPALSLAGVPPLSGFFAKLMLMKAALETGQFIVLAVALAVGLMTLMSMLKIWNYAFWRNQDEALPAEGKPVRPVSARQWVAMLVPVVTLAALTVLMGLAAGPLFDIAVRAAGQLMDPTEYIRAVTESR